LPAASCDLDKTFQQVFTYSNKINHLHKNVKKELEFCKKVESF
jgi:hypothetical protein